MRTRTKLSRLRYAKNDADFESDGTRCAGWLYTPEGVRDPPVVVMAPGFAAERTFGLPAFAERFVASDYAVFLFDYRGFGDSDGEPRNLVSPEKQVEDWEAAVNHVRRLDAVDRRKIALFGTSFAGGHALEIAANDARVGAVVAQTPAVDGRAVVRAGGLRHALKGTVAGLRDLFHKYTFRSPHTVPVVSDDEFAALSAPSARDGMMNVVPDPPVWRNEVLARSLLSVPFYRPIASVEEVTCPALLLAGHEDDLVPASSVRSAADAMDDATLVELPGGHFDPYEGAFDEVVDYETTFLDAHLRD